MLSRRTLLFEEVPLLPLPFLLTPPFETNDEADWMGSLAFQRLKNHKEESLILARRIFCRNKRYMRVLTHEMIINMSKIV